MGSSDNLMAGFAGALSGAQDVLSQYLGYKLKSKFRKEELADQFALYEKKLPLQIEAQRQEKQMGSDIDFDRAMKFLPHETAAKLEVAGAPARTTRQDVDPQVAAALGLIGTPSLTPAELTAMSGLRKQEQGEAIKVRGEKRKAEKALETPKWVISEVDRILPLNEKSSGGYFGGLRQKTMGALDIEDEKFRSTEDVVNSAKSMVASVLKSTFGGQLSDSEREYLNSVYGAFEGYSRAKRRIAMTNIRRMMENKINNASEQSSEFESPLDISRKAARPPLDSFEE